MPFLMLLVPSEHKWSQLKFKLASLIPLALLVTVTPPNICVCVFIYRSPRARITRTNAHIAPKYAHITRTYAHITRTYAHITRTYACVHKSGKRYIFITAQVADTFLHK